MTDIANRNFLSPLNFKFVLKRAPNVNFFIQSADFPGLSLPDIDVSNPLVRAPYPGDHLMYDELNISFKVDEDLSNFLELHNWIRSLGKLNYNEYDTLANKKDYTGESLRSDISLTLLTSNKNANFEVVFKNAFPIRVAGFTLKTTDSDVDYVESSASFRYLSYDIKKVV
jgi:hypothetical protein